MPMHGRVQAVNRQATAPEPRAAGRPPGKARRGSMRRRNGHSVTDGSRSDCG